MLLSFNLHPHNRSLARPSHKLVNKHCPWQQMEIAFQHQDIVQVFYVAWQSDIYCGREIQIVTAETGATDEQILKHVLKLYVRSKHGYNLQNNTYTSPDELHVSTPFTGRCTGFVRYFILIGFQCVAMQMMTWIFDLQITHMLRI